MDNNRDDGFDRSSQCFQELIQLIGLNSRYCNTLGWGRELNHTENEKVSNEKVLKMKAHLLAPRLLSTPLPSTQIAPVSRDSLALQARVSVRSASPRMHSPGAPTVAYTEKEPACQPHCYAGETGWSFNDSLF